jgi:hypothetical protein
MMCEPKSDARLTRPRRPHDEPDLPRALLEGHVEVKFHRAGLRLRYIENAVKLKNGGGDFDLGLEL